MCAPSLYCCTTSMFHGAEKLFCAVWGMGFSDANFVQHISCNTKLTLDFQYYRKTQMI